MQGALQRVAAFGFGALHKRRVGGTLETMIGAGEYVQLSGHAGV